MNISTDFSRRFTLENLDIRGQVVRLSQSWRTLIAGRDYAPHVVNYLGELACVSVLVGAGLKHAGRATLQIQGGAAVKLAVADCTHELGIRGMVSHVSAESALGGISTSFADWVAGGRVALTVSQANTGQMYQSIVPVSGLSVAECFEHYFDQSEQLPTHLWLAANGEGANAGAGALLLQKLPKADERDPDGWARVEQIAASVSPEELTQLDAEVLLRRLFHEEDVRLYEPKAVFCDCKRDEEKVKNMLRSLGREECDATLADVGEIVVKDDMCNEEYRFDHAAVAALFSDVVN
jgi:molecular chaperone Hsp33